MARVCTSFSAGSRALTLPSFQKGSANVYPPLPSRPLRQYVPRIARLTDSRHRSLHPAVQDTDSLQASIADISQVCTLRFRTRAWPITTPGAHMKQEFFAEPYMSIGERFRHCCLMLPEPVPFGIACTSRRTASSMKLAVIELFSIASCHC